MISVPSVSYYFLQIVEAVAIMTIALDVEAVDTIASVKAAFLIFVFFYFALGLQSKLM